MAIISIEIPDEAIDRVTNAFCAEFGYQETLPNGTPNPQTKGQFTKARVIEHIKQVTRNYEGNLAAQASRTTKETEINGINMT